MLKQTLLLTGSSVYVKLSSLIITLLLVERFGLYTYGQYVIALNLLSILSPITVMGLDVVLPKYLALDFDFREIQKKSWLLRIALIVIFIGLVYVFTLDSNDIERQMVFMLLPTIILGGFLPSGLGEHYATFFRSKQFIMPIVLSNILRSSILVIFVVYSYYTNSLTIHSYLTMLILGSLVFFLYLAVSYSFYSRKYNLRKKIILNSRSWIIPSLAFGIAGFIASCSMLVDIFSLKMLVSKELVGAYSLSLLAVGFGSLYIVSYHQILYPVVIKHGLKESKNNYKELTLLIALIVCGLLINYFLSKLKMIPVDYEMASKLFVFMVWSLVPRFFLVRYNIWIDLNQRYLYRGLVSSVSALTTVGLILLLYKLNWIDYIGIVPTVNLTGILAMNMVFCKD